MARIAICILAMVAASAFAGAFPDRHHDPLRGDASFTEMTRPPPLARRRKP